MTHTKLKRKKKDEPVSNPYAKSLQKVSIENLEGEVVARILTDSGQPTSCVVPYEACVKYDMLLCDDAKTAKLLYDKLYNIPF